MVLAIQENFDWQESVIPEPWLTWFVRWTTDDREVMNVLRDDPMGTDQEFEPGFLPTCPTGSLAVCFG